MKRVKRNLGTCKFKKIQEVLYLIYAEEAYKRATGRRRYHSERRKTQFDRRMQVLEELRKVDGEEYGMGRLLAKKFCVSEPTMSRDLRYVRLFRRKTAVTE